MSYGDSVSATLSWYATNSQQVSKYFAVCSGPQEEEDYNCKCLAGEGPRCCEGIAIILDICTITVCMSAHIS